MAYYTGIANNMTAVRQALIDACSGAGWAWDSTNEVLSKGALFLRLQIVTGYLTLLGRTAAGGGDAPSVVQIGPAGVTGLPFPLTYHLFAFATEVYLVVNYSVDRYQWMAFGQSDVSALPGTGTWVGASLGASIRTDSDGIANLGASGSSSGGYHANSGSLALFWGSNSADSADANGFVHHDLDGRGWDLAGGQGASYRIGIGHLTPLVGVLPNTWNSEAVLLPLRCYVPRPSGKVSLVADLQNARVTRVDHYTPGQVIGIGSDRWKIFPWYRKSTASRNGGFEIAHTGTFGWAIRYEGP